MKRISLLPILLIALSINVAEVNSAIIKSGLSSKLKSMDNDDEITVIVRLKKKNKTGIKSFSTRKNALHSIKSLASKEQASIKKFLNEPDIKRGISASRDFWLFNGMLLTARKSVIEKISKRNDVEEIHENHIYTVGPIKGNSVLLQSTTVEWGIEKIGADDVWSTFGITGQNVRVGHLDTGVDVSHPDLSGKLILWAEFDSSGNEVPNSTPRDSAYHGTHTAGTILGGNNSGSYIGVAPDASLISAMVLYGGGGTFAQVVAGMEWVIDPDGNPSTDDGAQVVSMSLGGGGVHTSMVEPTDNMVAANVFPSFSIGNSGQGFTGSPGNVPSAFGVGATDSSDSVASFSSGGNVTWNYPPYVGTWLKPDISAPGVNVRSSVPGNGYRSLNGTSMAAPHMSGVVALMLQSNPSLTVDQTKQAIINTAIDYGDPGQDDRYGWGRVDAFAAVTQVYNTGTLEGYVLDTNSQGVEATITALEMNIETTSDDTTGIYSMSIPESTHTIKVSLLGYETVIATNVIVLKDQTTTLNFTMQPIPHIVISEFQYDDPSGDNNDEINPGDQIDLDITLLNNGNSTAQTVNAILTSTDTYINITDNTEGYNNIASGNESTCIEDYDFTVSTACPDNHILYFFLEITDSQSSIWHDTFTITVLSPPDIDVSPTSFNITIKEGETKDETLTISNNTPYETGDLRFSIRNIRTVSQAAAVYTLNAVIDKSIFLSEDDGYAPTSLVLNAGEIVANLLDLSDLNVLYDISHGERSIYSYDTFKDDIVSRGGTVDVNNNTVTTSLLNDYHILWIDEYSYSDWSSDEKSAIESWVNSGGAILFHGDEPWRADEVALIFGIDYTDTYASYGFTTNILEHATTADVNSIYLSNPINSLNNTSPAYDVIYDNQNTKCVMAASEFGNGLVVSITEDVLNDSLILDADNRLLGNQVIDFLYGGGVTWLDESLFSGTIIKDGHTDITVTFDAAEVVASTYSAIINIISNDPDEGSLDISVDLTVTPFPRIVYSGSVIDEDNSGESSGNGDGTINPGETVEVKLILENTGNATGSSISAVLTSTDSYITINDNSETFGDIPSHSTGTCTDDYDFEILNTCPHEHKVNFTLDITDGNSNTWQTSFSLTVLKLPDIVVSTDTITVTIKQGKNTSKSFTIDNTGTGDLIFDIRNSPSFSGSANNYTIPQAEEFTIFKYDGPKTEDDSISVGPQGISSDPDDFGYSWIDSDTPGGPAYNWIDITSIGTEITGLGDDWNLGPYNIGFSFPFYGNNFSMFRFCTNGFISFTSNSSQFSNYSIPSTFAPENMVAPFWDDLNFSSIGSAYYYNGDDTLIISYINVPHYGSGGSYTFQIILNKSGSIFFQYKTMTGILNSATVGIQNDDQTIATQVVYDYDYIHNELAVWIGCSVEWIDVTPSTGTIAVGSSEDITVTLGYLEISSGTHNATLSIFSNDPDEPTYDIPVSLTVNPTPVLILDSFSVDDDNEGNSTGNDDGDLNPGETIEMTVSLMNIGDKKASSVIAVLSSTDTYINIINSTSTFNDINGKTTAGCLNKYEFKISSTCPGEYAFQFHINISDDDSNTWEESISFVVSPDISISTDSVFHELNLGENTTSYIYIYNNGVNDVPFYIRSVKPGISGLKRFTLPCISWKSCPSENGDSTPPPAEKSREGKLRAELMDLSGVKILMNTSHSETGPEGFTSLISDLSSRGAVIEYNNSNILDSSLLSSYTVLCVNEGGYSWTPEEEAAVVNWISGGGSLFLHGDQYSSSVVDIASSLGITFGGGSASPGYTTNILSHEVTASVNEIRASGPVTMITSARPAYDIVLDMNDTCLMGGSEYHSGKCIATADELFNDGLITYSDNRILVNQVFDWLSNPSFNWLSISPLEGTVNSQQTEVITLTFNTQDVFPGIYHANLQLYFGTIDYKKETSITLGVISPYCSIVYPAMNTKVGGNVVSIVSEVSDQVDSLVYEYRSIPENVWKHIKNSDASDSFNAIWDISSLENGIHRIRLIPVVDDSKLDLYSYYYEVYINRSNYDSKETMTIDGDSMQYELITKVFPLSDNDIKLGNRISITIPSGAINSATELVIKAGTFDIFSDIFSEGIKTSVDNIYYSFSLANNNSAFNEDLTINLPYNDSDDNGMVEGTEINENTLSVFYFNETLDKWTGNIQSIVKEEENVCEFQTNHFSVFAIFSAAAADLNNIMLYPNPFKPSEGHTVVNFDQLTEDVDIEIFTISGEQVWEEKDIDAGDATWDTKNLNGNTVGSGLYICVITNDEDEKKLLNLAIIR